MKPGLQAFGPVWVLLTLLLLAAGALGLYARLDGFGARQLDEYYTARSVEFILESGLPAYKGEGYYLRGPIVQYLMAASAWLFGATEFAYRLPALIFNLLSIPLAYIYVRRHAGVAVAAAVALALLVSSWHVEFARFARMYAPFQFMTLLFLLTVDVTYFGDKWRWRYLPHAVYVLAFLTHELGVLLAPILFLPLLLNGERFPSWRNRVVFGAVSLGVSCLGYASLNLDLRGSGAVERFPPDYVNPFPTGLVQPNFPFWPVSVDPWLVVAGLGAPMLAGAAVALWVHRNDHQSAIAAIGMLALLVLSLGHLLTLYVLALVVLLFRYRIHRVGRYASAVRVVVAITLTIALAWIVSGLLMPDRLVAPPPTATAEASELFRTARALQLTFFSWPDLYAETLRPFLLGLPVIGLLLALSLIYVAIDELSAPLPSLLRHPAVVIVTTMLLYGLFMTTSSTVRYWFHLYPVLLCLIALVAVKVIRRFGVSSVRADIAGASLFLVAFMLSSDFNPSHLLRAGSPEVAFRLGEFEPFDRLWFPRPDHKGPAEFLNRLENIDPAARIVTIRLLPVSYYLEREHAIYFGRETTDFLLSSRERGTRELWTNNRLLSTSDELAAYTKAAREVWVVRWVDDPAVVSNEVDLAAVWAGRAPELSRAFLSEDGRIEVIRARLAPARESANGG
jgi:4-amino-4-deoxy-L-arabinose transferase-like glycosyltransferase